MNYKINYSLALLFVITLVILVAYAPGLNGAFLLDDYGTLPQLAQWGNLNTFGKLVEYVFGGYTGPTGRPVALFSFILNAQTWPAVPAPFLLTNILIHLFNTLMLFLVLKKLLSQANIKEAIWMALVISAFWGLHVSQVSTVLYVVQRMAILAFTFNLLAILAYLKLREVWLLRKYKYSLSMAVLFGLCALLAVCSKENAALLPLQLMLVEFLIGEGPAGSDTKRQLKYLRWLIVYIPSILILLYLSKLLPTYRLVEVNSIRGFTPWQRQLTEFRVVSDYILLFFIPKIQTSAVFQDGYILSKSLFSPISTLYTLVFHVVCVLVALLSRKRWPLLFFGMYWFYVNHLIESSVVQLELKFEHRNYVPSLGLAVLLAYMVYAVPIDKKLKNGLVVVICGLLGLATYSRASLWGDPQQAALVWVQENPSSVRAIEHAILVYQSVPGHELLVEQLYEKGVGLSKNRPMINLKALNYRCSRLSDNDRSQQIDKIADQLEIGDVDWQIGGVFEQMLDRIVGGSCLGVSKQQYQYLLASAMKNKKYQRTKVPLQLRMLSILAELRLGDVNKAIELYQLENYAQLPLGLVMRHAIWLAVEGHQATAVNILSRSLEKNTQSESYLTVQAQDMLQKIKNDVERK